MIPRCSVVDFCERVIQRYSTMHLSLVPDYRTMLKDYLDFEKMFYED